jgi:hypothetical protein
MGVIDYNYYQAKEKELVFVNWLPKFPICVEYAEADANYNVFENTREIKGGVSRARDAL